MPKHAGRVTKAGTQCSKVYKDLTFAYFSSMELCQRHNISNVSAVISQVNEQISGGQVMVVKMVKPILGKNKPYAMFHIYQSIDLVEGLRKTTLKWRYYGDK